MKVAMIGSGGFAAAHLRVLSREPDVEIVGHVSRTDHSRTVAAERWGGRAYPSCEALLESEEVDAAWIAVPPHAHGPIEEALIRNEIPFFVEKPLSADRRTAESIGAALAEAGSIAGVGYDWRALEGVDEARDVLVDRPPRLVLAAWHGSTPPPYWWRRQELSGGQMVEQATHLFDLARYLVGEAEVIAATADHQPRPDYPDLDVATSSTALLRFASGAKGIVTATCLLQRTAEVYLKLICDGLVVTIDKGGVTFDDGSELRCIRASGNTLAREDKAFLAAVQQRDPALLLSSYSDALRTHHLVFDVVDAS